MQEVKFQSIKSVGQPLFIVMEGIDGSGKSTQAKLLNDYLLSLNISNILTREPGGTQLAEHLRKIILDPQIACNSKSELLLFMASRSAHVEDIIKPAIAAQKTVICDRFYLSTFAYQGYGRGLFLDDIRLLNDFATSMLKPDLTFIFDVDVKTALSRTGKDADRFEDEGVAFMENVARGYRELALTENNCFMISSDDSVEGTFFEVKQIIDNVLN